MGIRRTAVSVLGFILVASAAAAGGVRAWQDRITIEMPLPIPAVTVEAANPFASPVDSVPKIVASTPPEKVEVAGLAVAAAYVDAQGQCQGAVPLDVPFPGLTRALIDGLVDGRYDPAMTGQLARPSWVVLQLRITGKVKDAEVVSQELALPDPDQPPAPVTPALPPPAGHLLQLPTIAPEELTSLATPRRIRVHAPGAEPVVSMQALIHVGSEGRCDRFVPLVLDSGLTRWFSGYLASLRLEPATLDGAPTEAWVVLTARVRVRLSTLTAASFSVIADRKYMPQ